MRPTPKDAPAQTPIGLAHELTLANMTRDRRWPEAIGEGAIAVLPAFLMVKSIAALAMGFTLGLTGRIEAAGACGGLGLGDVGVLVMMWRQRNHGL
jgi:hypothetical protein